MKIRPVRAELFHADGQTNGHNGASSSFSQFYERAQKVTSNFITSVRLSILDSNHTDVRKTLHCDIFPKICVKVRFELKWEKNDRNIM
jgi:hypothetical protein